MLPVCRALQSLYSTVYVESFLKKLHTATLVLLCVLLGLWSFERAFSSFGGGKSETTFFKVIVKLASSRSKTLCPENNFDFFD